MSAPAELEPLSLANVSIALLNRCMEYLKLPDDQQFHLLRHSDSPAIYRQGATYLWTSAEQKCISTSLPNGWWKDSTHPFMECTGEVRLLPSHQRRPSLESASTVGKQMEIRGQPHARPFVMSDISPYLTLKSSARFWWLAEGPALFKPFNLLAATPSTIVNADKTTTAFDHTLAQFNLASRGTHTDTHQDWYGTDGIVHLLEGEKLWIMAPPEHYDAFDQLFPPTDLFKLTEVDRFDQLYRLSGSCAVHQRAGDIISVPAGWVHAVVNLTDTVSFGYSYLRPWKLHSCLKWAKERGQEESLSMVNLDGIFEHTLVKALPPGIVTLEDNQPFWGLSAKQIQEFRGAWSSVKRLWSSKQRAAKANEAARAADATAAASLQRLNQPPQATATAAAAATMED